MTTPRSACQAARSKRPAQRQPAAKSTKKSRRTATEKKAVRATRPGTKQATLLALLERPAGATIAQMCAKTGWQSHSVRAGLTGLRKRGVQLSRARDASGTTIYRAGPA